MIECIQNRDFMLRQKKKELSRLLYGIELEDLNDNQKYILEREFRRRYKIK